MQAWDRFAYVNNNPVRYDDPTGHCLNLCTAAIGALIGGVVGATLYLVSESQQDSNDWADLAVATGMGAVAGGLIGSGVGAPAGVAMLGGIGMETALVADHLSDITTDTDFSRLNHFEDGSLGFTTGMSTALLPAGTPLLVQGTVAASVVGSYTFLKHRFGLEPDDDPIGDTIEMIGAGVGGGLSTGSEVVDTVISTGIGTGVNVYNKTKPK